MKQKLAIIGANAAITMLIEKAKQLGYETHVFAWQCGDPGEKAADFFYPISIDQKEEILEKCRELGIAGICSITSDFAAPTVNFVARKLGLVCNPEESEVLARNKYEMRCALRDAGLFTPRFIIADEASFIGDSVKGFRYPLIVKPTDRWSSKGITRVDELADLPSAVSLASKESFQKKAIVEEFMDGKEYSAECICQNGQYYVLAFTEKATTGHPHYIETGHLQPALLEETVKNRCEKVFNKALKALGILNGAAHIEFRILSDGQIGIIEIGARMGGDCIGTDLTPISTGMDYIKMVIDVACGKPISFKKVTKPRAVRVYFIMESKDYEKYLDADRHGLVIKSGEINQDFEQEVLDSSTRHGFYIV